MKRIPGLSALVLLVAVAFLLSPPGLQWVARRVAARLESHWSATVQIEAPRLSWPGRFQLKRFRVYDEEQTYLDLQQLEIRLHLKPLWQRTVDIERIQVAEIHYTGWPETITPAGPEPPAPASAVEPVTPDEPRPGWLQRIQIKLREINLPRIVLDVGQTESPMELTFLAGATLDQGRLAEVRVETFHWTSGELEAYLLDPLHLAGDGITYALTPVRGRIGPGQIEMRGQMVDSEFDFSLNVMALPLATFGFARVHHAEGQVVGQIDLRGTPANPSVHLVIIFSELRPAPTIPWDGPPARFTLRADLDDYDFRAELKLEGLPGDPLQIELGWPWPLALRPLAVEWPPTGPLTGHVRGATDLGDLAALLVLDVHRLAGRLSVDIDIGGMWSQPDLSGHLAIREGSYEHDLTGTLLRQVELHLEGRQDGLWLERFEATDGGRGRLTTTGHWLVLPDHDYPFQIRLDLDRFRLLRNELATAIGHGRLEWQGNLKAQTIEGRLRVDPVEVHIPERLPPHIIDLPVTEIDGLPPPPPPPPPPPRQRELTLDVEVALPERFFVRGRGLDSEWGGRIQVSGPVHDPTISGTLSILRGRFVFFGRRLRLARGTLTLDGGFPPAPLLDIVAEARSGGITTQFRLHGPLEAPVIDLRSVPDMPEDEILARLLFGREAARITPWQAITLAQAVNRMRGGSSTFDLLGETRRRLHVDQIEIRDREQLGGTDETALAVGKYVGDHVYVEIERGLATEGSRIMTEVELTPNVRLETELGPESATGLDIIWMWEF